MQDTYVRKAEVVKIIDGDTLDLIVDMGFRRFSYERIRLIRVDTPEIRGEERNMGLQSKQFVSDILYSGREVYIQTYKGDAFGRWLAEVWFESEGNWLNLNDILLDRGFAVLYEK